MTTPSVDTLVEDYLARLQRAATALPPDRRDELVEGITEHLAAARAAGAAADEAAVRTLLDRLGEPEEIVAAAQEDAGPRPIGYGPPPLAAAATPPGTGLELAAVLLLTLGSFLPLVGWLVGVALLCTSRRWTLRDKLLGALVVPGGPGIVLVVGLFAGGQTCSGSISSPTSISTDGSVVQSGVAVTTETCSGGLPAVVGIPLVLFALIAPFVVAVVLYRLARRRADAEPPVLRTAGGSGWTGLEITAVVLLGLGSFVLPLIGPLVGLVLVFSSQRWSSREKGIATILALLPALLWIVVLLSFVRRGGF
jgi:hypothetical protein